MAKKHKPMPDLQYLRSILDYDPLTGDFHWKISPTNSATIGSLAGTDRLKGYRAIGIDGNLYLAHRLAYYYFHGVDPGILQIDHVNPGNRSDNRIVNLRLADNSENQRNARKRSDNTSGFKGVVWHKRWKKWRAQIDVSGKRVYLGHFNSAYIAHVVVETVRPFYHKEFARTA